MGCESMLAWIAAAARVGVFLCAFAFALAEFSSASVLAATTVLRLSGALSSSSLSLSECMARTLMPIPLLREAVEDVPEGWSACWEPTVRATDVAVLRQVGVSRRDSGKHMEAKCKAGRRRMKRWMAGRRTMAEGSTRGGTHTFYVLVLLLGLSGFGGAHGVKVCCCRPPSGRLARLLHGKASRRV